MENELDPKYQDLLSQLCNISKNPEMPAALQHLSSWDKEQTNKESPLPPAMSKLSLLQRMDDLDCSEDLRALSIPLEEVTPQKRPRSPLSSESSGRTLMSRLLNPKRRRLSTHISQKSSPSSGSGVQHISQPSHQGEDLPTQGVRRNPESDGSDDEDEGDTRSKRRRLEEVDMPWYTDLSTSTFDAGNPSCEETHRLLRAYNHDITKAKFFVRIAHNSPTGIPSPQWERILKGESIDLNHIFALLHHVVPDEERTGRLGDTEISFGVSEPKK